MVDFSKKNMMIFSHGREISRDSHMIRFDFKKYQQILYKYGTWVSAISIFIVLRKMILHEALAPSAISFFRVQ